MAKTVHPHGRGDNDYCYKVRTLYSGSPPRAWGQHLLKILPHPGSRFTPTGVGTTTGGEVLPSCNSVHPHGRGDNEYGPGVLDVAGGSPPRAWGQLFRRKWESEGGRFTPTGVGTTAINGFSRRAMTVHPHGRGDNLTGARTGEALGGSPPRAWGQRCKPRCRPRWPRFTPTGVGTTESDGPLPARCAVHPHGRGDNKVMIYIVVAVVGSPPRAWGQRDDLVYRRGRGRFTPTGVGTTEVTLYQQAVFAVHPHGRGDNT